MSISSWEGGGVQELILKVNPTFSETPKLGLMAPQNTLGVPGENICEAPDPGLDRKTNDAYSPLGSCYFSFSHLEKMLQGLLH